MNHYDPTGTDDINAGCAAFDDAFCDGSALATNDPMNTGVADPPGMVNVQCFAMYGLSYAPMPGVSACTVSPEQYEEIVDYGPPAPDCEEQLVDTIQGFSSSKKPSLAGYAGTMEAVAASDNLDHRLFAAIAVAENGSATNNPFAPGPNSSSTFSSIGNAISALGTTLDRYVYRWNETSVSALWSGNTWVVDPKKKWITLQPPAYCVGTTAAGKAGCQNTGNTISGFMKSMSANPNHLTFPCEN